MESGGLRGDCCCWRRWLLGSADDAVGVWLGGATSGGWTVG